jgi:hypothetical protein
MARGTIAFGVEGQSSVTGKACDARAGQDVNSAVGGDHESAIVRIVGDMDISSIILDRYRNGVLVAGAPGFRRVVPATA